MTLKKKLISLLFCFSFLLSCADDPNELATVAGEELFFSSFEKNDSEKTLLDIAEKVEEPWSGLALYELSSSYLDRPVPPSLGKISRLWKKYVSRYGYDEYSRSVREKISLLENHDPASSPLLSEGEGEELFSFLYRLSKGEIEDYSILYDYLDRETDEGELSFLLYYLGSKGLLDDLPRPLTEWLTLKLLVAKKEYHSAIKKVTELENYPNITDSLGYYRDVWRVVLSHPDRAVILTDWEERVESLSDESQWSLLFYSALCRRSMGHYITSRTLLTKALGKSCSDYQYDRTLWYSFDVLEKGGGDLAGAIQAGAPAWHDSAFFDDIVERAVSDLVYRGAWRELLALGNVLSVSGSPDSQDLIAWVTLQSADAGYISLSSSGINDLYREIIERDRGSFYTVMAEFLTTGSIAYYETLQTSGTASDKEERPELDLVFNGLVERNNGEASRSWYIKYGDSLSFKSLRSYAYMLRRDGDFLGSIRVMGTAGRRDDFTSSIEDLTLLYPLEYAGSIEYWCTEYNLPESFYQALVKTESGYDKDIISYAGAVGLSQLMPTTAEERMTLLGMESADLTDPDVNIALGTDYLRWLFDRTYINSPVQAAAAYNGGPGSVRKWNRAMGDYPNFLYMEGIPFTQTRDYVKSLLKGAIVYCYLYEDRPPEEILHDLFPELAG
jgi:hypothetical protein